MIAPKGNIHTLPTFTHCTTKGIPKIDKIFRVIEITAKGMIIQPISNSQIKFNGKYFSKYTPTLLFVGLKHSQPILKHPTAKGYPTIVKVSAIPSKNHKLASHTPPNNFQIKFPTNDTTYFIILVCVLCKI